MSSEQFYETDPAKPYQRGFALQNISPLPITYAEHVAAQGHWGEVLREYMRDYNHWAVMGALCEFLPRWENSVTLAEETDRNGFPVANFSYSMCDNDRAAPRCRPKGPRRHPARRRCHRDHCRQALRPPGGRLPYGGRRATRSGQRRSPELRRAEPVSRRRQRVADPGFGQPGADHHGSGRPLRRPHAGQEHGAGSVARSSRMPDDDHRADRPAPTPSPPIAPRRTGPSVGTRPPWSSSRSATAITRASAGPTPGRRRSGSSKTTWRRWCGKRGELTLPSTAEAMARAVRNLGRPGLVACAISAVDIALWDLKARALGSALE